MPVTVAEKYNSPRITTGQGGSIEVLYFAQGSDDYEEVLTAVEAEAGTSVAGLPRQSVRIEPVGPALWDAEVVYSAAPPPSGSVPPEIGESEISGDTSGGTQRITQSRQTIDSFAPVGVTPPDFRGAIGVGKDNVEGADIVVPVFQFAETHFLPDATFTPAFRGNLFALTGRTNDAIFRTFAEGEVLFLGASWARRSGPDGFYWSVTYRFSASQNATGIVVGDITGIAKKGWEYLWVRYEDEIDSAAGVAVKRPTSVHVEKVYDDGDFSLLGIGV